MANWSSVRARVGNSSGRDCGWERVRVSEAVDAASASGSDFSECGMEFFRGGWDGEEGVELWRRGGRDALRSSWVASSSEPGGRYSGGWAALMFSKAPSTALRASSSRSGMR